MTLEQIDQIYRVAELLEKECGGNCWKLVHKVAWDAEMKLREREAEAAYEMAREDEWDRMNAGLPCG